MHGNVVRWDDRNAVQNVTVRCNAMYQVLIDCSGPPDEPRNEETGMARKRDALLSQLERRMALRTLVFCNTIHGCRQASLAVDPIYCSSKCLPQFEIDPHALREL